MTGKLIPYPPSLVDTHLGCTWGWFKVKDLFTVGAGTSIPKRTHIPGNTRHITGSKFNNGCTAHIGNDTRIYYEPALTLCRPEAPGRAFYQPAPFAPSEVLLVLITPKQPFAPEVGLFITVMFELIIKKYSYMNQPNRRVIENSELPLPTTPTGEPDWGFMHGYMSAVLHAAASDTME